MNPKTLALRQRVYDAYGGTCTECGESDYDKLVLDHIHDDGAEERDTRQLYGASKYVDLIKRGFPKQGPFARQLLCYSCNQAKKLRYEHAAQVQEVLSMTEGRLQINSGVSQEVYSYIKAQKESRKCSEKQIIQEMYESHLKLAQGSTEPVISAVAGIEKELKALNALISQFYERFNVLEAHVSPLPASDGRRHGVSKALPDSRGLLDDVSMFPDPIPPMAQRPLSRVSGWRRVWQFVWNS